MAVTLAILHLVRPAYRVHAGGLWGYVSSSQSSDIGNLQGGRRERCWPGHKLVPTDFSQNQGVRSLDLCSPSTWKEGGHLLIPGCAVPDLLNLALKGRCHWVLVFFIHPGDWVRRSGVKPGNLLP